MNAHDMKAIRDLGSPMFDTIADRIEAEVKRLQAGGKRLRDEIADEGREYRAEIERLRTEGQKDYDEVGRLQEQGGLLVEALDDKDAEVERLRAVLTHLLDRIDHEIESKRLIRRVSGVSPSRCEWVEYQRARNALAEEVTPIHTDP